MELSRQLQSRPVGNAKKWLLLTGISLGYFLVLLDTTIVNVALPAIQRDLGSGITGLQWVVNAYTVIFAGLLLSMGVFADRFGAKRVFLAGLAIFAVVSVISSAAHSLPSLIVSRALLGVGGAALTPASLALLSHAYPAPAERARALGIWAAITGTAMAGGPVVGGLLVDTLGWRSIFMLNVPVTLFSFIIVLFFTSETKRNIRQRITIITQLCAIFVIAALCFALMEGETYGWQSPVILGAFGLVLAGAGLFYYAEKNNRQRLFPPGMFRDSTVSVGMIAGMLINIGLSGFLFIMPLFYQHIKGFSAHHTGLALLPMMIPLAFNPIVTGRLVARFGPRVPVVIGFGLGAAGMLLQSWTDVQTSYGVTILSLLLNGFGISLTIPAIVAAVISAAPKELGGTASGALNASRQIGATLGVVLFGLMISSSRTFVSGMHLAMGAAALFFVCGGILSYRFMGGRK
ncbi:major facilitator superfamily MFS_1 [Paenibacillus curdlanolyticus YK9]|uniref:Major facilitator superfamily MFS_1 n=1 Tax=Paenibacillus curdlanolyticus YK9 TaxID=717606 RepID=E0I5Q2_9BACL|nr:MFS transporter [Paenibacillus curdlanolyticus]EFM12294.1 major facilitator superfamily MFS_1 [Paenibacillus curdlanolyticus YK9]